MLLNLNKKKMKKRTKSSLGKTLIAFLIVGVLALGVNHFYSIWVVGEKEFYETNKPIQYGLGYLMNPSDSDWQEGAYGYFLMDSGHAASVANTVVEIANFNQDNYLWASGSFESAILRNDGSVPSGQLSTLKSYSSWDDRMPFESRLNIDYSINMPSIAGDYYIVVWRCDSAHYNCLSGHHSCVRKNTRCEVYPSHIKVRSLNWCDIGTSNRGDGYCWQLYSGYCDNTLKECVQPCQSCKSNENCIVTSLHDVADLRNLKNELASKGFYADLGCVPKTQTCIPTVRGYSLDCVNYLNIDINKVTSVNKPSVLTIDYPKTIDGAYCDIDSPDEITSIINKYLKVGSFGTCRAGCQYSKDCESLPTPVISYCGKSVTPEGHVCYDNKCYLRFCNNPSDCLYTYAGIYGDCNQLFGVCERQRCSTDYDCWSSEFMPSYRFAGGCVRDSSTNENYCMWKYFGEDVPTDHINKALCELASQNPTSGVPSLPGADWGYDVSSGKCVPEHIEPVSECNPSWSYDMIQSECIKLYGPSKKTYWSCERLTATDLSKGYCDDIGVPPQEDCRLADNPLIYCWNRVVLGYCEKPDCLSDGTCSVQKASCSSNADCIIGSVSGYCDSNGCCIWTSPPPTTTSSTIPNGGILPPGINLYSLIGIILCIAGFGLLMKVLRK